MIFEKYNTKEFIGKNLKHTLPYIDQMLVSGSHFIVQIIIARAIGIKAYGIFTGIWLVLLFVSTFHQAFMISPMLSLNQTAKNLYYKNLNFLQWSINLGLIFVFMIAFFLNDYFIWLANKTLIISAALAIIAFITHDFYRKVCYAKQNFKESFQLDILVYVPQISIFFILIFLEKLTIENSLLTIAGTYFIGSIYYYFKALIKKENNSVAFGSSVSVSNDNTEYLKETFNKHWKFSNWLLAKSGLQWLSGNFFLIAAGGILGATALGALRMSQNVIGVFNVVFLTLENIIPIKAAKKLKTEGIVLMKSYFRQIAKYGSIIIFFGLLFLAVLAEPLFEIVYGSKQSFETIWVFRGFCLLYFLVFHATLYRIQLRTLMFTQHIFLAYLFSALLSLIIAYPLITKWNIAGVMIGIILTQLVSLIYYSIYLNKILKPNENYTFRIG